MPHCCVPYCNVRTGKELTKKNQETGMKITLHRVPKDPILLQEFAARIKREIGPNFQVSRYTSICSLHYKSDDFYVFLAGRRELKPSTLPSIFDPRLMQKRNQEEQKKKTLLFKETDRLVGKEIDQNDDELSSETTDCDISIQFSYKQANCKRELDPLDISELKSGQDDPELRDEASNGVIPTAFSYEHAPIKVEIDPLDISGSENDDESHDDQNEAMRCDIPAAYSLELLHCKVEKLYALNISLTEELRNEAEKNRDFEKKFVKLSQDLQKARADLHRAKLKTQRYGTELVKLRADLQIPEADQYLEEREEKNSCTRLKLRNFCKIVVQQDE